MCTRVAWPRPPQDSSSLTPLIFVLSPGSDPMSGLLKFADAMRVTVEPISLGQGQGPKVRRLVVAHQQQVPVRTTHYVSM